ncbi:MAG: amidohydrolase family protein [bacterium]|nr:amidohydrolase family protein [bacterium]
MKKTGLAKFGENLGKMANVKFKDYEYKRESFAPWELSEKDQYIIYNINIIDVKNGSLKKENAILISERRIQKLLFFKDVNSLKEKYNVSRYIDGESKYLIPGLSDIHAHLANISEFKMSLKDFYYHDAQRMKNCETALKHGCTFIRNSGGAYDMVSQLKEEIENDRLLGPRIMPSYEVLTPKGGMWDINPVVNKLSAMIFGGKVLNYFNDIEDIKKHIDKQILLGSQSIKIYLEEMPIYGGKEDTRFNMFSNETVSLIRDYANEKNKLLESHAMFIKGARKAIQGQVNSIAHLTVDQSYNSNDTKQMADNNVAIVPTLSIGGLLSMNFGGPQHDEVLFYQSMMKNKIREIIQEATIPELRKCSTGFSDFVLEEKAVKKMPEVGLVHKERVLGFAKNAPESFKNFLDAGVKIGMGTDGGTGLTFSGCLAPEFEGYKRYGMSCADILRSATLTNMEILKLDHEFGSIDEGKYADMVLLNKNPLESIDAVSQVSKVFKDGKLYVDNEVK